MNKSQRRILEYLYTNGPATGLQMVKRLGIRRGVIYVHLSRLQDMGLVEAINDRKYALTEDGHRQAERNSWQSALNYVF